MFNNLFGQIKIYFRPLKISWSRTLDIQYSFQRLLFKPRKFLIRHKKFFVHT